MNRRAEDPSFPRDAEEARTDLELTRTELGETVQELAHKVNVPARAKDKANETAEKVQRSLPPQAQEKAGRVGAVLRHNPLAVAGTAVLLLVLVRQLARRGKNH